MRRRRTGAGGTRTIRWRGRRSSPRTSASDPPSWSARRRWSSTTTARCTRHGASYLDVVRALRGEFPHVPDVVEHPADEAGVLRALDARTARTSRSPRSAAGRAWSVAPTPSAAPATTARCRSTSPGSTACSRSTAPRSPRASRPARPARDRGAARRPRDDDAVLSPVVRALDARRLDRDPRRRPLRDRADPHRRPRGVGPRGDASRRRLGVAPAARLRRRPVARPPAARLRGHAGGDHRGVGSRPPARRAALERPRRARRLRDRARADPGDRPGRSAAVQLPADRGARGAATFAGEKTLLLLGFEGDLGGVEAVRRLCPRPHRGRQRRLAGGVPARALPARHARRDGRVRRDVRDRGHVGPAPAADRGRARRRPAGRHLPHHPRVPRRRGAVLHRAGARATR